MIKIFFRNCRGIGNRPTKTMLHHLIATHKPNIIFPADPKINFSASTSIGIRSLGFTSSFSDQNSSLWCFLKPNQKFFFLLDHSSQHITIDFVDHHTSSLGKITGVNGSTDYRIRKIFWDYLANTSQTTLPWCRSIHCIPSPPLSGLL